MEVRWRPNHMNGWPKLVSIGPSTVFFLSSPMPMDSCGVTSKARGAPHTRFVRTVTSQTSSQRQDTSVEELRIFLLWNGR